MYLNALIQKGKAEYLELKRLLQEGFLTLADLMELAKNDIPGAYDIIVETLRKKFVGIAINKLKEAFGRKGDKFLADEAAQRTFIRGYLKRKLFNPHVEAASLEGWLVVILFQKINEVMREGKKRIASQKEDSENIPEEERDADTQEGFEESRDEEKGAESEADDKRREKLDVEQYLEEKDKPIRKPKETKYVAREITRGVDIEKILPEEPSPIDDRTKRFIKIIIDDCKSWLDKQENLIIDLYFWVGLTIEQILPVFRQEFKKGSLGTIKNRLDSALSKLKECTEKKFKIFEKFI